MHHEINITISMMKDRVNVNGVLKLSSLIIIITIQF